MPRNVCMKLPEIRNRLERLEVEIREVKDRMPAHSAKPQIMMELFELEDEKAELQSELIRLSQ